VLTPVHLLRPELIVRSATNAKIFDFVAASMAARDRVIELEESTRFAATPGRRDVGAP
jgi:hypothetical protein